MIRKIAGKKQQTPLKRISIKKETAKKAIDDLLAETVSKILPVMSTKLFRKSNWAQKKKIIQRIPKIIISHSP